MRRLQWFYSQCATVRQNTEVMHFIWCIWLTYRWAQSYVNVFCTSTSPSVKPLQVLALTGASDNGAWLHKWGLDSWPVTVELYLARELTWEQQDGCRLRGPQPTLQLKLLSHPLLCFYACTHFSLSLSIQTAQCDVLIVNFLPFYVSCFASPGRKQ